MTSPKPTPPPKRRRPDKVAAPTPTTVSTPGSPIPDPAPTPAVAAPLVPPTPPRASRTPLWWTLTALIAVGGVLAAVAAEVWLESYWLGALILATVFLYLLLVRVKPGRKLREKADSARGKKWIKRLFVVLVLVIVAWGLYRGNRVTQPDAGHPQLSEAQIQVRNKAATDLGAEWGDLVSNDKIVIQGTSGTITMQVLINGVPTTVVLDIVEGKVSPDSDMLVWKTGCRPNYKEGSWVVITPDTFRKPDSSLYQQLEKNGWKCPPV